MHSVKREAVAGRLWRLSADGRLLAARRSRATVPEPFRHVDRQPVDEWIDATARDHERYRQRHDPVDADVAIVCVSQRPELIDQVVDNIARQTHQRTHAIFVANSEAFDMAVVRDAFRRVPGAHVEMSATGASLGACLNRAFDVSDGRFVAKFDDDDVYGSHHVEDSLRALGWIGAAVVGKHSYYAVTEADDRSWLRFPGREFSLSGTLAGGTLVIDRSKTGGLRFPDISLGEDRGFLSRCHRSGLSTYSADRFNFTQVRHGSNTWGAPDAAFVADALPVDALTERIDR